MDGSFACPQCGSTVEVRGLAAGRHVRCKFCQRLLEVPYLPRVPVAPWKRRRFARPQWVPWAWAVLGIVAGIVLVSGSLRSWNRHHQSMQEGSIDKLIESSRLHEASSRFGQALVDLDAALDLAGKADPVPMDRVEELRKRRQDLARRDAESVLDRLCRHEPPSFPLGDWLNLMAHATHDPDLTTLKPRIVEQFRSMVQRQADWELAAARRSGDSGQFVVSLQSCDRIAKLLPHLLTDNRQAVRCEVEGLVTRLVSTHGVVVEAPYGQFVFDSQPSYVAKMLPVLVKGLEAKGYLPDRPSSPWRSLWSHALYHLRLDVSESLEGNYLSSENRLTLIEARLTLMSQGALIWQTTPRARTTVPLPGLPAYQSSRLAVSRARSEELERLLYEDARGQIGGKFAYALSHMPPCP